MKIQVKIANKLVKLVNIILKDKAIKMVDL